jgi:dihydroorotase
MRHSNSTRPAFESAGALDRLEAFASFHGPDFYGLPRNGGQVTLAQQDWRVPETFAYADDDRLVPLGAGEWLHWRMLD